MSDPKPPFGGDFSKARMQSEIFGQMLSGAVIAAAVIGGPIVFVYVLAFLGSFLPEDSKEALDPTPDSFSHYEQLINDRTFV